MKAINDFDIKWYFKGERLSNSEAAPTKRVEFVSPPNPRLRLMTKYSSHDVLCYRGSDIAHHQIKEDKLVAQFEAEHGYVLFIADSDVGSIHFSQLGIYYFLKDFSGGEYGSMLGWDRTYTRREQSRLIWSSAYKMAEFGPDPLIKIRIADSRRLEFDVSGQGWFTLTLHENWPRPFLFSCRKFCHENSRIWDSRYFCVRRLS